MKTTKILSLILVAFLMTSCAMIELPPTSKSISSSKTKNELFVQANLWMVDQFNNAESVIQYSDKEAGVLKGKYLMWSMTSQYGTSTHYCTITITVRDGNITMKLAPQPLSPANIYYTENTCRNKLERLEHAFVTEFQY